MKTKKKECKPKGALRTKLEHDKEAALAIQGKSVVSEMEHTDQPTSPDAGEMWEDISGECDSVKKTCCRKLGLHYPLIKGYCYDCHLPCDAVITALGNNGLENPPDKGERYPKLSECETPKNKHDHKNKKP